MGRDDVDTPGVASGLVDTILAGIQLQEKRSVYCSAMMSPAEDHLCRSSLVGDLQESPASLTKKTEMVETWERRLEAWRCDEETYLRVWIEDARAARWQPSMPHWFQHLGCRNGRGVLTSPDRPCVLFNRRSREFYIAGDNY